MPTPDQTYVNAIIFLEKKKYGMDKVCQITGNTKSGNNGFSSANAAIEWGNEVKYIITTAVTSAIQQKDNENELMLTEMRTANEQELQKILQALATLRKRVDGLATREGNKGDGGDNRIGGSRNNGGRGGGDGNHNTSRKITTKKTMPTAATKSGYKEQAWSTIPRGPIRRENGSTKSRTWMTKS